MNIIGRLPTITHEIIHGYTVVIYTTNNICHVIKRILESMIIHVYICVSKLFGSCYSHELLMNLPSCNMPKQ